MSTVRGEPQWSGEWADAQAGDGRGQAHRFTGGLRAKPRVTWAFSRSACLPVFEA